MIIASAGDIIPGWGLIQKVDVDMMVSSMQMVFFFFFFSSTYLFLSVGPYMDTGDTYDIFAERQSKFAIFQSGTT